MKNFDVVVIGSGPGGYASAIRAAQLGKKTAIVEKSKVGGTCLNVGCIPSKTLLKHGEMVQTIKQANDWGIETGKTQIDYPKLTERKNEVVQTLTNGVSYLLKKNDVSIYEGEAVVQKDRTVLVGNEKIKGDHILLATGSKPFVPPITGIEEIDYETTDTFFDRAELPKKLAVIGGGVIASELASAVAMLGTEVTIIEIASDVLMTEEAELRHALKNQLEKQGIDIITQADIKEVQNGKIVLGSEEIPFDTLLVAAGRKPNLQIAEELGLEMDQNKQFVAVDKFYETSEKHIYAVGDLAGSYQLAHAASAEGLVAVHAMAGERNKQLNQNEIPRCIYTHPEAASIGLTEEEAIEAGYDVTVTRSSLNGNSKAIVAGEAEGFVKIVTEKKYQEILGVFIVGSRATEMIGELMGVKVSEGTINELAEVIQPHPALSEAIGETADALFGQAIHM
ncbi:dihydrolipoyl dehydrogenase [Virgibacillus ihumii]|uniref:dihydrolipoyl dehydrogenase n=1 Tax=Virgibacillus ihumii TaxID=2686091 RepID=UPI00157C37CD|nr:dihydrolipoyl dehydrogenase [Virgibacillus ihumii]